MFPVWEFLQMRDTIISFLYFLCDTSSNISISPPLWIKRTKRVFVWCRTMWQQGRSRGVILTCSTALAHHQHNKIAFFLYQTLPWFCSMHPWPDDCFLDFSRWNKFWDLLAVTWTHILHFHSALNWKCHSMYKVGERQRILRYHKPCVTRSTEISQECTLMDTGGTSVVQTGTAMALEILILTLPK